MKNTLSSTLPPDSTAQHKALKEKEEIFLAEEREKPESPYYQGNADPATQRRRFLLGGVAALGAGLW